MAKNKATGYTSWENVVSEKLGSELSEKAFPYYRTRTIEFIELLSKTLDVDKSKINPEFYRLGFVKKYIELKNAENCNMLHFHQD